MMSFRVRAVFIAPLLLLSIGLPSWGQSTSTPSTRGETIALQLVSKINAFRGQRGLQPFRVSPILTASATMQSHDMVTYNFFDHRSPVAGHRDPTDRAAVAGYSSRTIAENLFMSMGTADSEIADQCFQTWADSSGHLANMLDTTRIEIGVGVCSNDQDETYITAVFGRP